MVVQEPRGILLANLPQLALWAVVAVLLLRLVDTVASAAVIFFTGLFFAVVLEPPIRRMRRYVSRPVAVLAIVLIFAIIATLMVRFVVPPILEQSRDLALNVPSYAERIQARFEALAREHPALVDQVRISQLADALASAGRVALESVGRASVTVVQGLLAALLVLLVTLYTASDPRPLLRGMVMAVPPPRRRVALRILAGVSDQLQAWVRATGWLMLAIGVSATMGLWALGVKSPLLFGVLSGIGEAVPTIGPIVTAIPPILVTLADDPMRALWVGVFFVALQQAENHVLVPRIMASKLKLHVVSVLFFVLVMGSTLGPLGILLSTPLCASVKVVYRELRASPERRRRSPHTAPS
ncbi:MAG TPA: AI-2E family transporter [Chthonomonadales bacterium]|nr:AI-2E family transporter [Chthonomonadales bacterium]